MRTESLRRVYCDAPGCQEGPTEVWLPFDPDDIITALLERGFNVESPKGYGARHYNIGRVVCPTCAARGTTWTF